MILALATTATSLVPAGSPAGAAVQACAVSYTSSAGRAIAPKPADRDHSWNPVDVKVEDSRMIADIDVSLALSHPDAANLAAHVLGPKTDPATLWPSIQAINTDMASGVLSGAYSFDDEAGAKISGASPQPGRFSPATPATALEGVPGTGTWSLWLLNRSASGGTLHSFTVTLTYATCDSDGDGVEESADNCPTVANDQANRDGDSLGDACDLDDDSDDVPDVADGCPTTPAKTATGCPGATRTASLVKRTRKRKLVLTAKSDVSPAAAAPR